MNKAGFELNELPELIEKGKLTRKEAINFIAEEIHRNPGLFLISKQNDEIKSELVFRFLKNGYFVFDHYKKEFGKFRNYLISYLRYQRLTIHREKFYENVQNRTYTGLSKLDEEDRQERYSRDEFSYKIVHYTPYIPDRTECAPYQRKRRQPETQTVSDSAKNNIIFDYFYEPHSREGKLVIILTLKSSPFLSENQIKKISKFCQTEEKRLENAIKILKKSVEKKYAAYKKIEERRNTEYFFMQKFRELLQANTFSKKTPVFSNLLNVHEQRWHKLNNALKEKTRTVCPTNKAIAQALGICQRQVGYYLKNIESREKLYQLVRQNGGTSESSCSIPQELMTENPAADGRMSFRKTEGK